MIVLGVVLIIISYLINELGKKAESTIKTTTDTQTKWRLILRHPILNTRFKHPKNEQNRFH